MMGVFNNLILFDQSVKQNSLESIRPELATSWAWSEDGTKLTFQLRQGVKWHDGQPFTAKDVECTWNYLIEKSTETLRVNPRLTTYKNLDRIEANGDFEVTFHLKRPQPAFPHAARRRRGSGVPMPCLTGHHAPASDWHRTL